MAQREGDPLAGLAIPTLSEDGYSADQLQLLWGKRTVRFVFSREVSGFDPKGRVKSVSDQVSTVTGDELDRHDPNRISTEDANPRFSDLLEREALFVLQLQELLEGIFRKSRQAA